MDIKIIYENDELIVVNKPSGLLVHPTAKNEKDTLVSRILENYPKIKGVGEVGRDGIVHRLDKETSGLLVVARNSDSYEKLKKLFKERKIKKKYYALVWGHPKESSGIIKKEIRAHKGKRQTVEKYSQIEKGKTRTSETHWEVIKKYKDFTLLDVEPITGRTHQIRVHLDSVGHPIVCDKLYGKKKPCPEGLGRVFLHAYFLQIPFNDGELLEFEEDLPEDLSKFLNIL